MATKRAIFVGPSLYGVEVPALSGEVWKSPAAQGDILDVVLAISPRVVVLIDGVFHQSQSVWHKEIAYALMRGVVVIGAASMGALRAAEMAKYGMIGVGKIFEMYRDGEEDDSLVAMTFEPETYQPYTESRVGQHQKQLDALEAIEFSRNYRGKVQTSLTVDAISPFFERCILSTLERQFVARDRR
jgi:hypothetical protein